MFEVLIRFFFFSLNVIMRCIKACKNIATNNNKINYYGLNVFASKG